MKAAASLADALRERGVLLDELRNSTENLPPIPSSRSIDDVSRRCREVAARSETCDKDTLVRVGKEHDEKLEEYHTKLEHTLEAFQSRLSLLQNVISSTFDLDTLITKVKDSSVIAPSSECSICAEEEEEESQIEMLYNSILHCVRDYGEVASKYRYIANRVHSVAIDTILARATDAKAEDNNLDESIPPQIADIEHQRNALQKEISTNEDAMNARHLMRLVIDDLVSLSKDYIEIDEDLEDMKIDLQRRQRRKRLAPEEKQRAEKRIAQKDQQRNDFAC